MQSAQASQKEEAELESYATGPSSLARWSLSGLTRLEVAVRLREEHASAAAAADASWRAELQRVRVEEATAIEAAAATASAQMVTLEKRAAAEKARVQTGFRSGLR